ncbi:uncharacterized protein F5891DRAFT_981986 [Suillus fuscotomentosus]|uniref:Uncharacterized protein n=1 Tax=Suillus fuscotomentosus TaxID=1912939 RepID=A0AAD4HHZ7_9AGAM|nr:uncharacterized protein F5891DRAFT_981986 [Suillus fuscotomentosus]KAG1898350.1 hypothetical protein F5891DRAFT_981986 [Suillus fuscotomentosus]
MTPSEAANNALNATLAAVQPLMKRCMKLKEGDPESLTLLDDIARRVLNPMQAKDLRMHAGDATSFSLQLLSCAAMIRQYSKGGTFECVPDWTSVSDNDLRIQSHPRFDKTVGYRSPSEIEVSTSFEPVNLPVSAVLSPTDTLTPQSTVLVVLPTASIADGDPITSPDTPPRPTSPPPKPADATSSTDTSAPPATPFKHNLFVAGTQKKSAKVAPQIGKSKKRKAADDTDEAVTDTPELPPRSSKLRQQRKKKFRSDEDPENAPTGTVYVIPKQKVSLPVAAKKDADPAVLDTSDAPDDKGFQDADTRPALWGQDSHIATPLQAIFCPSSPPEMKITCAIDGVGVRERLQAKTTVAASNPPKHSGTRILKSRAKTPGRSSRKTNLAPPPPSSSGSEQEGNDFAEAEQQPTDVLPGNAPMAQLPTTSAADPVPQPEQDAQPAPANAMDAEPTARHILQSIQDLGRRLDLFATNEQVEALEVRVASAETNFNQRLNTLEQRLNISDARRRAIYTKPIFMSPAHLRSMFVLWQINWARQGPREFIWSQKGPQIKLYGIDFAFDFGRASWLFLWPKIGSYDFGRAQLDVSWAQHICKLSRRGF